MIFTKFDDIVKSQKKYKIIYADPPWQYNDKLSSLNTAAEVHYDVMNIDNICELSVSKIADDNCILFCWGTWPLIQDIFKVFNAWKFDYKTCGFVWVKEHMNGATQKGMGHWTRANSEFCLIGTRGKPKRIDAGIAQVVKSMLKEHSKKPDIIRNNIVKLCGDIPRIELFARTRIQGWDVFGNDKKLTDSEVLETWI